MLKILVTIILLMISNQTIAGSKCQKEWDSLKNVQSQLRHKTSEYLRDKERKKHKIYQDCRTGKNKKSKSSKKRASYKKPSKKYYPKQYTRNTFSNSPVKLKTKFKGEKQEAWLRYYDMPKKCIKPKNISTFSTCLNYRDSEADKFEAEWVNQQR